MKVECQNCFTDVIPMSDGRCPACNQPVQVGQQSFLTKVTVFQGGPSGSVCMRCGVPTRETVRVSRTARNDNYNPTATASLVSYALAVVFNFFAGKFHQTVEVKVPLCGKCNGVGTGEPQYIDFEKKSMTFVGHRIWKGDIERERQAKPNA